MSSAKHLGRWQAAGPGVGSLTVLLQPDVPGGHWQTPVILNRPRVDGILEGDLMSAGTP